MAKIYVNTAALLTPVGLRASQTCGSVGAGIARFSQLSWKDKAYDPFVMASISEGCLPVIDIHDKRLQHLGLREQRMLRLFAGLREELAAFDLQQEIPLIIGLGQYAQLSDGDRENDIRQLTEILGVNFDLKLSSIITKGRASGLLAIIEAIKIIESQSAQAVLVGGCDTYKDLELLGRLDVDARLKSETNRDGFIPGEGAGLLLLTAEPLLKKRVSNSEYQIMATATGFEEGHLHSEKPYRGEGLSLTFKSLFNQFPLKLETVYSTMNGESYWGKEWGVATIRYGEHLAEDYSFEHPADCYGDLGAASGPVMAALAMDSLENKSRKGPVLIYTSSDDGERAAIIIDKIKS
jgi:3-oxoacyl-[acyl-carrier-protein] synthase I